MAAARRLVIKLGTRVLTEDGGLADERFAAIVATVSAARRAGREVIVVTSGAVGIGYPALGLSAPPTSIALRQACAAVGQSRLTERYRRAFAAMDLACAQLLVDQGDLDNRQRAVRLGAALTALLRRQVVPVVNENDAVAGERQRALAAGGPLTFGDNDRLAALLAGVTDADLLVLLTDVAGVFDRDPRQDSAAALLDRIDDSTSLPRLEDRAGSTVGRGGMASKVAAALIASRGGCQAVIADGRHPGALSHLLAGEVVGTWFPAGDAIGSRRRWIAWAAAPRGALILDRGAVGALRGGRASLLAAGVTAARGRFSAGDVVELHDPDGIAIGRAYVRHGADAVRRLQAAARRQPLERSTTLVRREDIAMAIERPTATASQETPS